MFESQPQRFNDLMNTLRAAANAARTGDPARSDGLLATVAAIDAEAVVQLALATLQDTANSEAAFNEANSNPSSEIAQLGPYLVLLSARLLHGGLARDFESFWQFRLEQLRSIRTTLLDIVRSPSLASRWLHPAVNEVAIAVAVISKMMLISNNNSNQNQNTQNQQQTLSNVKIPRAAINFVRDEWTAMVTSVADSVVCCCAQQNNNQHQNQLLSAPVICTVLRQCVEECGLSARSSLARGIPLENHDNVRQAIFDHSVGQFLCATTASVLRVANTIRDCGFLQQQQQQQPAAGNVNNNDQYLQQQRILLDILSKLVEVLFTILSWGPTIFSSQFGVDRVPSQLSWRPLTFRQCLFSTTNTHNNIAAGGGAQSGGGGGGNQTSDEQQLLTIEALIAVFNIGLLAQREQELTQTALHCLVQFCSICFKEHFSEQFYSPPDPPSAAVDDYQQQNENQNQQNLNQESSKWTPTDAARWVDATSSVLYANFARRIFYEYLPRPETLLAGGGGGGGNNINNNDVDNNNNIEMRIENGALMLRSIATASCRLVTNAIHRSVVALPGSVNRFPSNFIDPLHHATCTTISYAHDLTVVNKLLRNQQQERNNHNNNNFNSGDDKPNQTEEILTEVIDDFLKCWRELARATLDDVDARVLIRDSPLEACIVTCTESVFAAFVNSRVRFGEELAFSNQNQNVANIYNQQNQQQQDLLILRNLLQQQQQNISVGLITQSIQSHGFEYTKSQITTIGLLGRSDPAASCRLLVDLLAPRVGTLTAALAAAPTSQDAERAAMKQTEAVWYLINIFAWIISDNEDGYQASVDIPSAVVASAVAVEREALAAGAYNAQDPQFWAMVEERVAIFQVMRGCFSFCYDLIRIQTDHSNNNNYQQQQQQQQQQYRFISPLLVAALLSLFRRYAQAFLDVDAQKYATFSRVFVTAFDGGVAAATTMVDFLSWSVCFFHDDDSAMQEGAELLRVLAGKDDTIAPWLMSSENNNNNNQNQQQQNAEQIMQSVRCSVLCRAAAGNDSTPPLLTRLPGKHRGALAGALVSACNSGALQPTGMAFLQYYRSGFSGPIAVDNFPQIADTVTSITHMWQTSRNIIQLGALVTSAADYLREVVHVVVNQTPPPSQNYELLRSLLSLFMNGIEICSLSLSHDIIVWMLQSSLDLINMVGFVLRFSYENILPQLSNNNNGNDQRRQQEEQELLQLLRVSAASILGAAQWANMNLDPPDLQPMMMPGGGGGPVVVDQRGQIIGRLVTDGMLLVLREARATGLIEARELNVDVFRLVKEVAQTHTQAFLSTNDESATLLLDATHWSLHSADPELIVCGLNIIEALTIAPNSAQRMPRLLQQFLVSCMDAVVSGTAVDQSVQAALSGSVFALGVVMGVDALINEFWRAVQTNPLLLSHNENNQQNNNGSNNNKYVRLFAEAITEDITFAQDRRRRRLFQGVLRKIVVIVKGASIFA